MTMRKHRADALRALCARVEEEDGTSPRREHGPRAGSVRKDRQFSKQVQRALNSAVMAESGSAVLRELVFVSADPAPDATRLRIGVAAPMLVQRIGPTAVLDELRRATGFLRTQVAAVISRKRVPELMFVITPDEPGGVGAPDEVA
jgi:hypothetical protein